jgi:branched-chain amino acid transport system permease protein
MTIIEKQKNSAGQPGQLQAIWNLLNDDTKPYRPILRMGLLAGIVLLYLGVIGVLATFNEREVIRETLTLGQLLMVAPALVAGYRVARKLSESHGLVLALVGGVLVGLLTAVPSLLLIWLIAYVDISHVFVNVDRNWLEVITFDHRKPEELLQGGLMLLGVLGVSGLAGALLGIVPETIRRSLILGLALALTIGVMGETVELILKQNFPDDLLDIFFERDTLLLSSAIGLFILGSIGGFLWIQFGKPAAANFNPGREQAVVLRYTRIVMLVVLLLALPFIVGRSFSDVMVTIGIYVLMGLGLNMAIGLAGLLDLGFVTTYAVGAYVLAIMTSTSPLGLFNADGNVVVNFWMVLPIAMFAAMLIGLTFAVPVLKMRGDYLAIATLGFGEIIGRLAVSDWFAPYIGGAQGMSFLPNPRFFGWEIKDPEQLYYIVLAACAVTLLVSIRLNNSRIGRQWMAIREDEDVAASMGINVPQAKLLAFTLSAATGGIAGAIFATKVGTVFPNSFTVFVSINVLSLIIVGGMGSNPGIVLGAIVLMGLPELLREFSEYRWLMYGILLIWMMLNRPEGLWPSEVTQRELHDSAAPAPVGTD